MATTKADLTAALETAISQATGDQVTDVKALVDLILYHARRIMVYGSDSDRIAFTRSALPALTRALAQREEAEEVRRMREAYTELQAWIRNASPGPIEERLAVIRAGAPKDATDDAAA